MWYISKKPSDVQNPRRWTTRVRGEKAVRPQKYGAGPYSSLNEQGKEQEGNQGRRKLAGHLDSPAEGVVLAGDESLVGIVDLDDYGMEPAIMTKVVPRIYAIPSRHCFD